MMLDPHNLLAEVHPDLVKVLKAAAQTPQAFQAVYGIRTLAAEEKAVAEGHSETLHSRHLPDAHDSGLAMAVDIGVFIDGEYLGSGPDVPVAYGKAAGQIISAADFLGVAVQWGGQPVGAWIDGVVSHFRDWGHFQLDPAKYP
jgi:peptidoglycan L-alanyl-D-glutamate endopeptidase CwlK